MNNDMYNTIFSNFIRDPSIETVELLDEDDIEILISVTSQISKNNSSTIIIENKYNNKYNIDYKLSTYH